MYDLDIAPACRVPVVSKLGCHMNEVKQKSCHFFIFKMTIILSNWWIHVIQSIRYHIGHNSTETLYLYPFYFYQSFKKVFSKNLHSQRILISWKFLRICLYCDRMIKLPSIFWYCPTVGFFPLLFDVENFRIEISLFINTLRPRQNGYHFHSHNNLRDIILYPCFTSYTRSFRCFRLVKFCFPHVSTLGLIPRNFLKWLILPKLQVIIG